MGDAKFAQTTLHARRACEGDEESLAWLAERFHPVLLAQARYRLGRSSAGACDPEDLVGEVWCVALPKLAQLERRDGRITPVVVRFLATTLVQLANNHMRRQWTRSELRAEEGVLMLSAQQRALLSEVQTREHARAVHAALRDLPERDLEVVLLRGIEQLSNNHTAELLGESPNAVSLRYNRALTRLRHSLPDSIFAELEDA